jgi:hypothetical protein
VARGADRYEIVFHILSLSAPKLSVVNLQICHGAARLTPPPVLLEDLPVQLPV